MGAQLYFDIIIAQGGVHGKKREDAESGTRPFSPQLLLVFNIILRDVGAIFPQPFRSFAGCGKAPTLRLHRHPNFAPGAVAAQLYYSNVERGT